ncbi:hypothetical protein ACTNB0_16570 [Lachnospiraceae bacterium HCP28S3_F9]
MSLYFSCADVNIKLTGDLPSSITEDVIPYFIRKNEKVKNAVEYTFQNVAKLNVIQGTPVYYDSFRIILKEGNSEIRIFTQGLFKNPYAIYKEIGNNKVHIQYIGAMFSAIDMRFVELLVLEKYFLTQNALILHGCFIEHKGKAIVFSAPSGTGKSTQGYLWTKYENAKIINGDRCVLQNKTDNIYVSGLPFCGSSTININKTVPLCAIVIVKQAKRNFVEIPSDNESIKKIMSETTINYWNSLYVEQSLLLIENIVNKSSVFCLNCTISKEAVDVLKREIMK